jgi:hypothetical protein
LYIGLSKTPSPWANSPVAISHQKNKGHPDAAILKTFQEGSANLHVLCPSRSGPGIALSSWHHLVQRVWTVEQSAYLLGTCTTSFIILFSLHFLEPEQDPAKSLRYVGAMRGDD